MNCGEGDKSMSCCPSALKILSKGIRTSSRFQSVFPDDLLLLIIYF